MAQVIDFKDFNFKLLIIEELMYRKKLIQPAFDVYNFVKLYDKRKIDIDEEGYDPIPEVIAYFKDLDIEQSLAAEVTELYQDGGNEVYMQIGPLWDGEDEIYDIASFEDVDHFPNLKKMTLFNSEPEVYAALKAKGITAQQL